MCSYILYFILLLQQEKLRNVDAKKAAQVERLGMGVAATTKGGVGHSVLNQMNTIVQVILKGNKSVCKILGIK